MAESLKESFYRATMQGAPADERARDMVLAAANGELWKIRILHEELQVDVRCLESEALDVAAEQGYLEIVKYLLAEGCSVNKGHAADGFTPYIESYPFILALRAAHWEVAAYMLDQGANPAANNNQPLLIAAEKDSLEFIHRLFETGKLDNIKNNARILDQAAKTASCEVARFLLSRLPRCQYEYEEGLDLALLSATKRNFPDMMRLLLDAGASPNAWRCLEHSATEGNAVATLTLLQYGADAALDDYKAFRGAVLHNRCEVVRLMLEFGCLQKNPAVFGTLPVGGKFGSPLETSDILREWQPACDESRKAFLRGMYVEFLTRDFPGSSPDLHRCNAEGRSLLVALILAGRFETDVQPHFPGITADMLLQRDAYGMNAVEALARFGELDALFSPAFWVGRAAELNQLWQGVAGHHRKNIDIEGTISAVQRHALKEIGKRLPRLQGPGKDGP